MSILKIGEHWHKNRLSGMLCRGDPHRSWELLPHCAKRDQASADVVEGGPQGAKEGFSRLCRRYGARSARQQPYAEALLKRFHGMAQGGLRHAELRCGLREAALIRYHSESGKVV